MPIGRARHRDMLISSTLEADLLEVGSSEWLGALETIPHDVYHLPSYVAFAAEWQYTGEPLAYVVRGLGGRLLIPLVVREIPVEVLGRSRALDATSPRFYPGPIAFTEPGVDAKAFLRAAIRALLEDMRERGFVSAFVRLHPLLSPAPDVLQEFGSIVHHGESVSIDLVHTEDMSWRQTRENHRRDIRRAERLGYVARIDDSWDRLTEFACTYEQTMERIGARPFWHLSERYFRSFRDALGDSLHLCVVERDGELAAGGMLTEEDGIVEYHLSGTAAAHLSASPSKLIINFARGWARERGNRTFHLGGSLSPMDSLNAFKLGFSRDEHPVYTWRVIADRDRYTDVLRATAMRDDAADGYFPAYRAGEQYVPRSGAD